MRAFLLERFPDRHARVLRARAIATVAPTPGFGLRIQIIDVRVLSGGEEIFANITNASFNTAFLVPSRGRNGARFKAIVR